MTGEYHAIYVDEERGERKKRKKIEKEGVLWSDREEEKERESEREVKRDREQRGWQIEFAD